MKLASVIVCVFTFLCLGCKKDTPQRLISPIHERPLNIVVSFSILADFVEELTKGRSVELSVLVPLNTDPHIYEATPLDAQRVNQADLVIVNGLTFEGWIDRMVDGASQNRLVIASRKITQRPDLVDPHAWHDVACAKLYVQEIGEALMRIDPNNRDLYANNQRLYLNNLEELDHWIRETVKGIPLDRRLFVTTHDAFWYLCRAYGFEVLSPLGVNTQGEPAPKDVACLMERIQNEKINAIFIEHLAFPRLIEEVARSTGRMVSGRLFADGLSKKEEHAHTYISMMRHNIESLTHFMKIPDPL